MTRIEMQNSNATKTATQRIGSNTPLRRDKGGSEPPIVELFGGR